MSVDASLIASTFVSTGEILYVSTAAQALQGELHKLSLLQQNFHRFLEDARY